MLTTGLDVSLNETTNYYDIGHCSQVFAGMNNVVYLVHGYFPVGFLGVDSTTWIKASWFYDIKVPHSGIYKNRNQRTIISIGQNIGG